MPGVRRFEPILIWSDNPITHLGTTHVPQQPFTNVSYEMSLHRLGPGALTHLSRVSRHATPANIPPTERSACRSSPRSLQRYIGFLIPYLSMWVVHSILVWATSHPVLNWSDEASMRTVFYALPCTRPTQFNLLMYHKPCIFQLQEKGRKIKPISRDSWPTSNHRLLP